MSLFAKNSLISRKNRKREVALRKLHALEFFFNTFIPPPSRRYTLGAGGTAIFLALVLVVSVLLKKFYCIPATGEVALFMQVQDFARTSHKKGCRFYGLKKMIWGR